MGRADVGLTIRAWLRFVFRLRLRFRFGFGFCIGFRVYHNIDFTLAPTFPLVFSLAHVYAYSSTTYIYICFIFTFDSSIYLRFYIDTRAQTSSARVSTYLFNFFSFRIWALYNASANANANSNVFVSSSIQIHTDAS